MALDYSSSSTNLEQQPPVASIDPSLSRNSSFNNSRLNAHAPEFVPRTTTPSTTSTSTNTAAPQLQFVIPTRPPPIMNMYAHAPPPPFHVISPVHHYMHHHQQQQLPSQNQRRQVQNQNHQRGVQREEDQQQHQFDDVDLVVNYNNMDHDRNNSCGDSNHKILNQVEYYFSDLNLATTDHLMRHIKKDPEGYVPLSVVTSFRKIKAFTSSISHLATILRNSSKLVVSKDGKKVRRQQPFTESDVEELQSRIVVAENLPEDHCHQNLMKIFSSIGSVKTIRTCQPQTSGGGSSGSRSAKSDNMHFNNKLHAFVEYESVELAEKAVAELNEEAYWRGGLRLRLMFRRTAKSAQPRGRKGHDGEEHYDEQDASASKQVPNEKQLDDTSQHPDFNSSQEHAGGEHVHGKKGGQSKGRSKGRGRAHNNHHNNSRVSHVGTLSNNNEQSVIGKQPPGPRMPDGTRGFSLGRGKPITTNVA